MIRLGDSDIDYDKNFKYVIAPYNFIIISSTLENLKVVGAINVMYHYTIIVFGCGSPHCEWLQLENIRLIFQVFPLFCGKIARDLPWFVFPLRKLIDFLLLTFWE